MGDSEMVPHVTDSFTGAEPRGGRRALPRPDRSALRDRATRAVRRERDSLGAHDVPAGALYGLFTERARETFRLTGRPPHPALIRGYGRVKKAAARVNARLGLIPPRWARAIEWAADHGLQITTARHNDPAA